MPYTLGKRGVYKKTAKGKKLVGHSKNPKKYLRMLNAVEHGWKPKKRR